MKILVFKNILKKKKKKFFFLIIKNMIIKFKKKTIIIIKLVNKKEILKFNIIYRGIKNYTNILSFKFDKIYNIKEYLGDLVIYSKINKLFKNINSYNFLHIVIHGILHLLNFDHINIYEKKQMEILEIEILNIFGYNNPYYFIK